MTKHTGKTTARTLTFKEKLGLYRYIEDNTHDGEINLWPKQLAETAGLFLKLDIAPSTVKSMCDEMDIKLRSPVLGGAKELSATKVRIMALEEDVEMLKSKVEFLLKGVCSKEEYAEVCDGESAHQPLLASAVGHQV